MVKKSILILFFTVFLFLITSPHVNAIEPYQIPVLKVIKLNGTNIKDCVDTNELCNKIKLKRGDNLEFQLDSEGYVAIFLKKNIGDPNYYLQMGQIIKVERSNELVGQTKLYPGIDTYVPETTWQLSIITSSSSDPFKDVKRSDSNPNSELPTGKGIKKYMIILSTDKTNIFQDFEINNNTSDNNIDNNIEDYCRSIWYATCSFESKTVHSGNRSIRVGVKGHTNSSETGGTVRIFSSNIPLNFSSVKVISIWVYDTHGNNTIELRLCNNDKCPDKVWSGKRTNRNNWTQITWPISEFKNVDKENITAIEIYEWNKGVYYFDDITYR